MMPALAEKSTNLNTLKNSLRLFFIVVLFLFLGAKVGFFSQPPTDNPLSICPLSKIERGIFFLFNFQFSTLFVPL